MNNQSHPAPRKRGRPPVAERSDYKSVQLCMTVPRDIAEVLTAQELRRITREARHVFAQFVTKAATALVERRTNTAE